MMVHFCLVSYSWHTWTLEVSASAYFSLVRFYVYFIFWSCIGCAIFKTNSATGSNINL